MPQHVTVGPFTISSQTLQVSGTTWAQFKAGGVKAILDNLVAANAAITNPTVAATVASSSAVSSLPLANGYIASYTWVDALGETTPGTSASAAFNQTSATTNLNTVTIPALPTGAKSANIYLFNPANGRTSLYAEGVTTTTFAMSYALPFDQGTSGPPAANTTGGLSHINSLYAMILNPNTELVMERIIEGVSNYLSGYPMEWREVCSQSQRRTGMAAYWFQTLREAETLIQANPPTGISTTLTPIGFPVTAGAYVFS